MVKSECVSCCLSGIFYSFIQIKKPIHILHIAIFIYGLTGAGSQRKTLTLVEGGMSKGHRVDLVIVKTGGALTGEVPAGVQLFQLKLCWLRLLPRKGLRKLKLFCRRSALADYLRQNNPDVLMSVASHASLAALVARRRLGTNGGALYLVEKFSYSIDFGILGCSLVARQYGRFRPISPPLVKG